MEDRQEHTRSSLQRPVAEYILPAPASLCALLQEQWLLQMVLKHLVEYGLEDCRLVCRKWRDVCRQLPIKLAPETHEQLAKALNAFPNADSLSMMTCEEPVEDIDFLSLLSTALELRTLELASRTLELTSHVQHRFQSVTQLRELKLYHEDITKSFELLDSVRNLTALTRLDILFPGWDPPPVKPFVELKEIRRLRVSSPLFVDASGACFFPSLTNLTSLQMKTPWFAEAETSISLQVRRFHFGCMRQ